MWRRCRRASAVVPGLAPAGFTHPCRRSEIVIPAKRAPLRNWGEREPGPMVGKAGLRPGAWSRHRPRLALAYARLAGVTAGVGERGVNAVRTSPGTTAAPAVNPAGIRPRARSPRQIGRAHV